MTQSEQPIFQNFSSFSRRFSAAALVALILTALLLTGLAAAAGEPAPAQSRVDDRTVGALLAAPDAATAAASIQRSPSQTVTPTQSLLPAAPNSSGQPATGRTTDAVQTPAWVQELMLRGGSEGISNGEVVVWKDMVLGQGADGQAVNGEMVTYAISVTNNTTATIRDVALLDVLPRGALQEPIECIPNVACEKIIETQEIPEPLGGTILVTETRQISWTIASVAPGTSAVRRFRGRLVGQTDGSVLKNQAFATYQVDGVARAVSSNETQTIVRVDALLGAGATVARTATWFSSDRGGTLSLDWGDFDRDGDLDLVLGSSVGTSIYRNDGGRLRPFWSNARRTFGVRWGDFDGDGTLDLVAVGDGETSGLNYIYTISGVAVQETSRFTATNPFVRVAPGDFDKDGDLDLIVSTNAINASCPVQMFKNSGGVFTRPTDAAGGCVSTKATAAIVPGDVDNDGDLDLALGLFPNAVQLFINDGAGLFPAAQHRIIDNSVTFLPYSFSWGDFNGDGFLDLAAAYPLLRQARIYRNVNGTSFTLHATLRTDRFLTPFSLDWGDFTGDGLLDLAVANLSPLIYEQTADGFVRRAQLTVDAVRGQIWSVRGVDLDRDGDLDLSLTNRDGPSLMFTSFSPVLKTTLTPVPATTVIANSRATAPASAVAWGDLTGDGLADLIFGAGPSTAGPNALSTKIYYNTRSVFNRFDEVTIGGFGPHAVALADVDNDNAIDLAVGTSQGTLVYRAGALNTAVWQSAPPHVSTTALAWGDYDDDRDLDLLVASSDGPLRLYANLFGTGTGLLSTSPVWSAAGSENSRAVAWADLNGDSYLDFVVANDGQPNRIYINRRQDNANLTTFVPMNWPVAVAASRAAAWGDYDGDGDLDLAVGNYGQSNAIYENRGIANGLPLLSATPIWLSRETSRTTSLAWGDWDNDGDLDLAVGNDGEADQVYVNRRDPTAPTSSVQLSWLWTSARSQRTTALAWGDVDNDGDLDLAVSQLGDSANSYNGYYENTTIIAAHLQDVYRAAIPLQINPAYVAVGRPGGAGPAGGYAAPALLSGPRQPTVTVPFVLYDPDSIRNVAGSNGIGVSLPITRLAFEYSLDGGGRWRQASGTISNSILSLASPNPPLLEGSGNSERFISLPAGTIRFEIKHDGQNQFTVWLRDQDGRLLKLLAEKVGAFDGVSEVDIPSDATHRLQVRGDGNWLIKVESSSVGSGSTFLDKVTPTRLGQSYAFIWNAQKDAAISENARFRVSLVQADSVGPVKQASAAAVSPAFRVRGTTCVWPNGLSIRQGVASPDSQQSVLFTGLLSEGTGVMTFTWDFGDGTEPIIGQQRSHSWLYGGVYTVRLKAEGAPCPIGRSQTITKTVTVGGAAPLFMPLVRMQNAGARLVAEPPAAPGQVGALDGALVGGRLTLSWQPPPAADDRSAPVTGYRLYRADGRGEFLPVAATEGDTTYFTLPDDGCGSAWLVAALGPGGEGPISDRTFYGAACSSTGGGQ